MALDFSQIKAISIPEGSVKQIADSQGNILWKKEQTTVYRQLEYIQSTSNAQNSFRIPLYISFTSSNTTNLDIWYSLTQTTGQFYGAILSAYNNSHLAYVDGSQPSSQLRVRWNSGSWLNLGTLSSLGTSKHNIGLWNGQFWLDGNSKGSSSAGSVTSITLFSQTPDGREYSLIGRFYELIMKENNVETHHFVPAQRKSDGVLGVYDTVAGVFRVNEGTGTFLAGPVTDENPSWSPMN